jgi:indole-3-acetate monooxygenase
MPAADTRLGVDTLLLRAGQIAPLLDASAVESLELNQLAPTAAEALRDSGLFRLWWPAELGGTDASLADAIEVVAAVAEADTSAAWNLGVCTLGSGLAGAYLSDAAVTDIFAAEEALIAGQTAPIGTAVSVDGGLLVSGRWSFGSGIRLASWVKGGVTIARPNEPAFAAMVVVPADVVMIDGDSWDVAGLAGSGSFDYRVEDHLVPEGYWYTFPLATPRRGTDRYRIPIPGQLALLHAGFALGAGRRALSEVIALVRTKVRAFDRNPIAHRATFRKELAEHQLRLDAARLLTFDAADRLQSAVGDQRQSLARTRELRAVTRHLTDVAVDAATWAYRTGGGTSLRNQHPLQRYLRDLLAATQHVFVDELALVEHGTELTGEQP